MGRSRCSRRRGLCPSGFDWGLPAYQRERVEPALTTAVATPPRASPAPLAEPPARARTPSGENCVSVTAQPVERTRGLFRTLAPVATAPRAVPVTPPPPPPLWWNASKPRCRMRTMLQSRRPGIAGTVTDAAGVVVPGRLTVRPVAGASAIDTRTDGMRNYALPDSLPGSMNCNSSRLDSNKEKKQIDLQPPQLNARADSIFEVGAATDTVTAVNEPHCSRPSPG